MENNVLSTPQRRIAVAWACIALNMILIVWAGLAGNGLIVLANVALAAWNGYIIEDNKRIIRAQKGDQE